MMPIWMTRCNGSVGILFNPNRDLMRSYHAENRQRNIPAWKLYHLLTTNYNCRFQLYYYSDSDVKKDERKETILTIDTRSLNKNGGLAGGDEGDQDADFEDLPVNPLEMAIKTKYVVHIPSSHVALGAAHAFVGRN